jgi:hypothetical protein
MLLAAWLLNYRYESVILCQIFLLFTGNNGMSTSTKTIAVCSAGSVRDIPPRLSAGQEGKG